MATKRTPRHRDQRPQITSLAVDFFHRALALRPIHQRCLQDRGCRAPGPGERCRECLEYSRLSKALANELGINSVVDYSPLNVAARMPGYIRDNPAQEPDYRRAQELRQALLAAAGELGAE